MSADRLSRRDFLKAAGAGVVVAAADRVGLLSVANAQEATELPHPLSLSAIEVSHFSPGTKPAFAVPGSESGTNTLSNPVFGQVRQSIEGAVRAVSNFIDESTDQNLKQINEVTAVTIGDIDVDNNGQVTNATPTAPSVPGGNVPVLITSRYAGFGVNPEQGVTYFNNSDWATPIGGLPGGGYMFLNNDGTLSEADFRGVLYATGTPGENSRYEWVLPQSGPWEEFGLTEQEYVQKNEAVSRVHREFPEVVQSPNLQFDPVNYSFNFQTEQGIETRFRPHMGTALGADGTYHQADLEEGSMRETGRFSEVSDGKRLDIVFEGQTRSLVDPEYANQEYPGVAFADDIMASPEARQTFAAKMIEHFPSFWNNNDAVTFVVDLSGRDISQPDVINRWSEGGLGSTMGNVAATGHTWLTEQHAFMVKASCRQDEQLADRALVSFMAELLVMNNEVTNFNISYGTPAATKMRDIIFSTARAAGREVGPESGPDAVNAPAIWKIAR